MKDGHHFRRRFLSFEFGFEGVKLVLQRHNDLRCPRALSSDKDQPSVLATVALDGN
jgi:hypothetical protein